MKLGEVLNKFANVSFLLTVDGLCSGLYGGVEEIRYESRYREYKERDVREMLIITTNGMPELRISLWEV